MDQIVSGVNTHKASHIAVAINPQGARLGTMTIAANEDGYPGRGDSLCRWSTSQKIQRL
jgi:hypothetical protein